MCWKETFDIFGYQVEAEFLGKGAFVQAFRVLSKDGRPKDLVILRAMERPWKDLKKVDWSRDNLEGLWKESPHIPWIRKIGEHTWLTHYSKTLFPLSEDEEVRKAYAYFEELYQHCNTPPECNRCPNKGIGCEQCEPECSPDLPTHLPGWTDAMNRALQTMVAVYGQAWHWDLQPTNFGVRHGKLMLRDLVA